MGVMDKFLNVMKLNDVEDEFDSDDYYDDEEPVEKIKKNSYKEEEYDEPSVKKTSQKVTPIRQVKRSSGNGMQVCVIKPTSVEDAREITETLLANRTVVLNMEGLDLGLAQRIIDFTSGSCYAIDGNLQKVSNYIFIITPASVDISGDLQGIVDAFDFSGIQTGF